MGWYLVIKFLHVISTMIFVGGIFGRQLVRAYAKKTEDVQIFAALTQGAGRIENIMIIPGNLAVILSGLILALMGGYPLFGFLQGASQNWLLLSNILLIVGLALVPTIFIPRGKKFDPVLEAALAEGRITPKLRTSLEDQVVKLAHLYEEISILIVVALMVFKPF
jgi:uncharacterized membrane protein